MRSCSRSLFIFAGVLAACRSKDSKPVIAHGAAGHNAAAVEPAAVGTWSAVIAAGKGVEFHTIASGELSTFVLVARSKGEPLTVNGTEVLANDDARGDGLLQFDTAGKVTNARVFWTGTGQPPFVVGKTDALVGIQSAPDEGDVVATFPSGATVPIDGSIHALTRTASGAVWTAGVLWHNEAKDYGGDCYNQSFLAQRNATGTFELVACGFLWRSMSLAAVGDDIVFCGSHIAGEVEIGDKKISAGSFLARIGPGRAVRWLRAINELGATLCEDLVVTSDGDIVAAGTAGDNADFTEGAIAKGIAEKPFRGFRGSDLWLARYAADGTRRWGRTIGETILGDHPSLTADREGNAILTAAIMDPLDLGHGPVGPDGAVMAATIDRDAKVLGMLVAHGGAYSARGAVDAANGLLFGFSTSDPVKIAGMTFEPKGRVPVAVIVRVPLPLPPPPAPPAAAQ